MHTYIAFAQFHYIMSINIALFASGSGSNAENIIHYFENNSEFNFPLILSNKSDAYIHERAKQLNIPSFSLSYSDFKDGNKVVELLQEFEADHIVLAGFLLKISDPILKAFPGKIINIHPALLPKYGGKGMYGHFVHEAVIEAGETESGITIHYIDENYDEGGIIFQATCPIVPSDTPDDLSSKVHQLEYEHFPKVIEQIWG